ncbi:hypothetical protein SAY86_010329 [Trapa natans]|uniref:X8 domain-containing protein n=1 Tax=Trapa natans TaxID=22666 RepID=A0AAN7L142_TRANT|nr:hypothetical protein SAY86_010329 [Trapa natans]
MLRPRCILRTLFILLFVSAADFIDQCDAKGRHGAINGQRRLKNRVPLGDLPEAANAGPYGVGSPFNIPPFDWLPPVTLATGNSPAPFSVYPPSFPTPTLPPPPPTSYYLPPVFPSPPAVFGGGGSPVTVPTTSPPPYYYFPAPPSGGLREPPVFLPPVVFPEPKAPPTPSQSVALWCVAKPSVPDPIIQEAMNYACGSGADCSSIQPDGTCFQPDTLYAHASFAFNSYWQRTKVSGGTCSFGGTAILVLVDPSYDGCHFVYY